MICVNCESETDELVKVQGYLVCLACESLAALPWWDR